ncbi:DDE Tnp 1 7 domain containing protein, partial [Asbolus verrucosus]
MMSYFSRHSVKQFIRGKPIRYGYKMWCLCEPNGYLIQYMLYQGKESNRPHSDLGVGGLKLANRLQELGVGYTGTIMANKIEKCPANAPKIKKKVLVSQPHVIAKYNKYMGSVDRIDENIDRCRIPIRSKKWWWANFAFCIDTSVHNAWQIYGRNPDNKLDYLHFRRHIVQVYFLKYGYPPTHSGRGHPKTSKKLDGRVPEEVRYDGLNHWMVPAEKQNRCALCKKNSTKKM